MLGDDHPGTLISLSNMGFCLSDLGRLEEAETFFVEAVAGARRSLPKGHWYTGGFLHNYGRVLQKLKRFVEGETALLEAQRNLETALGAEHQRTVAVVESLAEHYDAWHTAEPDGGYGAKAAEWRAKFEEWQATTQPAESP